MVILALGDVVGSAGCTYVRKVLPGLRKQYGVDMVVANGENSAEGNGILPASARHLFDSGVDVITTGNHGLRRREMYEIYDRRTGVIRPANYHPDAPGEGWYLFDSVRFQVCVINLQGLVYMIASHEDPYQAVDRILEQIETPNIIVDFHAEATAEKLCLAYYLDGRVSAVLGTHTHVPTADARVLPKGTGYISDLGMCGGMNSVLGVRAEQAQYRMRTGLPTRFENEPEEIRLCGAVLEIDESSGRCRSIEGLAFL